MLARDSQRRSLEAYLENSILSMQWIVEVLKDCSIKEFDQIVSELREKHGRYVRWMDIREIRGRLIVSR
jgi:uncharacterized protein with HEPN domain